MRDACSKSRTRRRGRDQADFDETSQSRRCRKVVLEVLAGIGVFAALLMSIIALNNSSEHNTVTTSGAAAPPATS